MLKNLLTRPDPGPPPSQETLVPARPAGLVSDVLVPLLQALISGGLLAGVIVFVIGQLRPRDPDLMTYWRLLALFLSTVFWLGLLGQTRKLLWAAERWFEVDLDRDGYRGDPSKRTIDVKVQEGGHHTIVGARYLEMDDDNLIRFAQGLQKGRKLTEGTWAKDSAFPEGLNEFRKVRGRLLDRKLIEPIYPGRPNTSYRLTRPGQAWVAGVLRGEKE